MGTEKDVAFPQAESDSPSRTAATADTDGDLTLGEAASLYEISRSSLRRKLKAKKVPGAYQISGSQADEWRIPHAALEKMGVERRVANGSEPAPGPEVGLLSGYFIDAIKKERHRRLSAEAERLEAEAQTAGAAAEREKLRSELLKRQRALAAAESERASLEREREAAQIAAWKAASELQGERRRRAHAETRPAADGAPALAQTWGARISWSFFGVAATLGALALVASLLADSLLFDRDPNAPTREEPVTPVEVSDGAPTTEGTRDPDLVVASITRHENGSGTARRVDGDFAGAETPRRRHPNGGSGARPGSGSAPGGDGSIPGSSGSNDPPGDSSAGSDSPPVSGGGSSGDGSGQGGVASAAETAAGTIGGAAQGAADTVGDTVDSASSAAGSAGDCICGAVSGVADAAGAAAGTAGGATGGSGDPVGSTAGGASAAVGDAEGAGSTVGGAVPPLP
jgi:hypothetical protein